jgi:hypothetical protein
MQPPIGAAASAADHDSHYRRKPEPAPARPHRFPCQRHGPQPLTLLNRNEITFLRWRRVGCFRNFGGYVDLFVHLVTMFPAVTPKRSDDQLLKSKYVSLGALSASANQRHNFESFRSVPTLSEENAQVQRAAGARTKECNDDVRQYSETAGSYIDLGQHTGPPAKQPLPSANGSENELSL